MRALRWEGANKLAVGDVPDPEIRNGGDVVVRVTRTVTCGSDLHLIGGYIPFMQKGDVLGHEFVGVVRFLIWRREIPNAHTGSADVRSAPNSCRANQVGR